MGCLLNTDHSPILLDTIVNVLVAKAWHNQGFSRFSIIM